MSDFDRPLRWSDLFCHVCGREVDDCGTCRCVYKAQDYLAYVRAGDTHSSDVEPGGDDQ